MGMHIGSWCAACTLLEIQYIIDSFGRVHNPYRNMEDPASLYLSTLCLQAADSRMGVCAHT